VTLEIGINLPPEGLILRDFILTTLAYMCRDANAEIKISPTKAIISTESITDLATAYVDRMDSLLKSENLPPRGLYARGNTKKALNNEEFQKLKKWIDEDFQRIEEALRYGFSKIEWAGPIGNKVICIGEKSQIAAPLLFKINYYAGKRAFLSSRYRNADIRLNKYSLLLTSMGVALSRIIIGPERTAIYLPVLNPGAVELHGLLSELLRDIRGRLSPDIIFKILMGFKLRVSGSLPLHLIIVNESSKQRPTLLSYQDVSLDRGISRFSKTLRKRSYDRLMKLLAFTLRNWDTTDRNQRTIIRVGFDIAHSIYMASTGAIKPADAMYHLARATYATTSDDFSKSLTEAKYSPIRNLDVFKNMMMDIEEALERCLVP